MQTDLRFNASPSRVWWTARSVQWIATPNDWTSIDNLLFAELSFLTTHGYFSSVNLSSSISIIVSGINNWVVNLAHIDDTHLLRSENLFICDEHLRFPTAFYRIIVYQARFRMLLFLLLLHDPLSSLTDHFLLSATVVFRLCGDRCCSCDCYMGLYSIRILWRCLLDCLGHWGDLVSSCRFYIVLYLNCVFRNRCRLNCVACT
jgi:hypothetical protein